MRIPLFLHCLLGLTSTAFAEDDGADEQLDYATEDTSWDSDS